MDIKELVNTHQQQGDKAYSPMKIGIANQPTI